MLENRESHAKQQLEDRHLSQGSIDQRNTPIKRKIKDVAKHVLILSSLLILADILIQQSTYPLGDSFGVYFAYFAVPFFISSVFISVYVYSYPLVKIAWKNKGIKLLSIFAGIAYAVFYIFTTNMVSTPDVPMPPNLQGFILPFQVYDHLAVWPDVEFWSPQLNLVGYFSVGSVLVVSSIAVLISFSVGLLAHNIKGRSGKQRPAAFVGSFATSLSTNACCCCTPVILPAVLAVFGLGASSPIAEDITFQTMPIFNLLWVGTLMLIVLSILSSVGRTNACNRST